MHPLFVLTLKFILTPILIISFNCLILPILLIILAPLYVYRWTISKYASKCRPDLGKMVTSQGVMYGAEDIYSEDCITSISSFDIQTPKLPIKKITATLMKNVINAKDDTGTTMYPELLQTVKSSMGYLFWTRVENFDIKNHITVYDTKHAIDTNEKISNLFTDLARNRKWIKGRPLWEILLVNNITCQESIQPFSMFILRYHHLMSDGLSMANLQLKLFEIDEKIGNGKITNSNKSCISKIFGILLLMLKIPYDIVDSTIENSFVQKGVIPEISLGGKRNTLIGARSVDMPVKLMKEVKRQYGVSMTSLIIYLICSGVRNKLLNLGATLPQEINVTIPVPKSGHPDKLRNHMSMAVIGLPVGEMCPQKRLKIIHKKVSNIQRSSLPFFVDMIGKFVGSLPLACAKLVRKYSTSTPLSLSNLPGPTSQSFFMGTSISGIRIASNFPPCIQGWGFLFVTYCDKAWITAGSMTKHLSSLEHVQQLAQMCVDQLDELSKLQIV